MVQLQLPTWEGPLQLLLELIERRRLDISELSLAAVADQYLERIAPLGQLAEHGLRADQLAEFIEIGGRLVLIKARQIVPPPADEAPSEADQAASELVAMVEEYRRYRDAVATLGDRDRSQRRAHAPIARPNIERPLPIGLPDSVTLNLLTRLALEALERARQRRDQQSEAHDAALETDPITVRDRVADLRRRLAEAPTVSFRRWIETASSRRFVIVSFLALLELHKARAIELQQDADWGDIQIQPRAGAGHDAWDALSLGADSNGADAW